VILLPGSDRQTGARRFGLELRRALAERGETVRGFSASAGIGRTRLQNWLSGDSLPAVQTAERVADLLMWPRLAELARAGRERACDDCGRVFTVETASPQRYCSTECKRAHNKVAGSSRDLSRAVMERRVRRLTGAVELMCRACEPSGVCRTPDCPLQVAGVSSHRLVVAS
jgi:hypothetical protein